MKRLRLEITKLYSCVLDTMLSFQLFQWINPTFPPPPLDRRDNSAEWCCHPTRTMHLRLINLLWTSKTTPLSDNVFHGCAEVLFNRFSDHVVFELSPAKSWQAFRTLGNSANNLWSSAVRRGPAPQFKCQKDCILANWLVKGQPVSDNETHGGCSLEVLRAAGAYKSCPGDGQRLSPPGMVYEGCSWQLFREQNNAL